MIISIDFDGVIARTKFPEIIGEYPYAAESIAKLRACGHYVIINTCRDGEHLISAMNFMAAAGIVFDRINDNHPGNTAKYGYNARKVYAHCYLDDHNLGGFPGWPTALDMIRDLDTMYQSKK